MSINHFEYRYAYLSSRYPVTIRLEDFPGRVFPSAFNGYWALIYPDAVDRLSYPEGADSRAMLDTMSAIDADRYGTHRLTETFKHNRAINVPEDVWVDTMRKVVRAKFDQHPNLRKMLVKTNGHRLFNINTWDDTFWGIRVDEWRNYIGKNWLGVILMDLRDAYLKETAA